MPRVEFDYQKSIRRSLSLNIFMVIAFLFLSIVIPWIFLVEFQNNQNTNPLIGLVASIIMFPLLLIGFLYMLILNTVQWSYLGDTVGYKYKAPASDVRRSIENILKEKRIEFKSMRSMGNLPDRRFRESYRLFYEVFILPANGMKIIVSLSGPPDEQLTSVFIGPTQLKGTDTFQTIFLALESTLVNNK